jgi:hypothetical protein
MKNVWHAVEIAAMAVAYLLSLTWVIDGFKLAAKYLDHRRW